MSPKAINYELVGRSLIHPIQNTIINLINIKKPGTMMSPSEMSKATGISVGNVSYHTRILAGGTKEKPSKFAKRPLLKLADEKPVRGAMEHFYRLTVNATVKKVSS